jgi:predicted nucleotidyltransferase
MLPHLRETLSQYPISACYLFGSQATQKTNSSSDYDFALLLSDHIPMKRYPDYKLLLTRELLKVAKSEFVDVVILNDKKIPLLLKFNIIKEGVLIYEKDKNRRINLECGVLLQWYDQQYFENLWYQIFTKSLARGEIL